MFEYYHLFTEFLNKNYSILTLILLSQKYFLLIVVYTANLLIIVMLTISLFT